MKKNNMSKEEIFKTQINDGESLNVIKKRKLNGKLILCIILFILFFSICIFFASKTVERKETTPIKYSQSGNVDYKVYLNPNEFYAENYLEMNKTYVASLINYIDIDFNYLFNIDKEMDLAFEYKIIGELAIANSNGSNKYLEKEYTLLDSKIKKMVKDNQLNIKENIKIDYGYYNQLANSFKSTYGVDINSYLNVYMEVESKNDNGEKMFDEPSKLLLRIPLSEKAIEINFDSSNQNTVKQIVNDSEMIFNQEYLILEIAFLIPSCIFLVIIIRKLVFILDIYTPYDKYINKILREYDRLIVETNSPFNSKSYNIIRVKNFNELLDARDNLKLPIIYLNTIPHHEGLLYIINDKNIYLLQVDGEYLSK